MSQRIELVTVRHRKLKPLTVRIHTFKNYKESETAQLYGPEVRAYMLYYRMKAALHGNQRD